MHDLYLQSFKTRLCFLFLLSADFLSAEKKLPVYLHMCKIYCNFAAEFWEQSMISNQMSDFTPPPLRIYRK